MVRISYDYDEARKFISDGDVIVLRGSLLHSPLSLATRLLLRTPYTHASIALWLEGGLWVSEMWSQGNVLVPLSQYAGENWDVFKCPVEDTAKVKGLILKHMRNEIRYDFGDLMRIAANRLLGVPLPEEDDETMVCSSYVPHVLMEAGWAAEGLPSIAAPDDLARVLGGTMVLAYTGTPRK